MLDKLKKILGITDDTQDDYLLSLIADSQELVEAYIDRKLDVQDHEEYIEVSNSSTINLRNFPVQSVVGIETLEGAIFDSFKIFKPSGMLRMNQIINGDFVVNYSAGYDPLPAWAQKAIIDTATALHYSVESGGSGVSLGAVKSEEIVGVAKVMYETGASASNSTSNSQGGLPLEVTSILDLHRNNYA